MLGQMIRSAQAGFASAVLRERIADRARSSSTDRSARR